MQMIDTVFGVSPDVLALRSRRTELIANNIANADTPHYKAVDLDFSSALAQARGGFTGSGLQQTNAMHIDGTGSTGLGADVRYRMPIQPSLDGNTVEVDREHLAFMDNAIRYQASLNFLNGRIQGLLTALRGE